MYKLLYKIINKNLFLLIVMWILFGHASLYAQNNIDNNGTGFSGIVIDQYGNPLSGVEISIKKSGEKIITDENGTFSFDRKLGDVFTVSHPRFLVQEFKLPKVIPSPKKLIEDDDSEVEEPAFKVRMVEKYIKNPEMLDVLYGTTDKASYLGSASTIYNNQMTTTLSSNIIASFAGRLPGLYTAQTRGMRSSMIANNYDVDIFVGNRPKFNIGGYGDNTEYNLNSRNAGIMVLVDGVQRDFYSLDPEDIESVSIQKDALSSIGLGMRSSRSVLLITTKKPVDRGFQISLTGKFGIQKPLKQLKPVSSYQYAYLLNEALQNDGKPPMYNLDSYQAFRDHSSPYTHPDVDWYDEALKDNSTIQSYNLNASGGGKVAQYYVGLSYLDEKGLFKSSDVENYGTNARYQRYLITSRVNVNVTNDFKIGVSLLGRIEDGNQPGATTSSILNNIFETPNNAYPVYNPNGSYGGNISFNNSNSGNDLSNIMAQTTSSGYIKDNKRDGMASIKLDYNLGKFLPGLSARAQANIATQSVSAIVRSKSGLVYEYLPNSDSYQYYGNLKVQENSFRSAGNYQQLYGQVGLNYITNIGLHNIGADFFGDIQEEILNYDLPMRPSNLNLKATYNYDKKYFAEAAVSRGYFNRYKPGKRWGTFFALGLGWDISKENFLKHIEWINQFKIRGVYGKTGNGVSNSGYYIWRQAYEDNGGYPLGYERSSGGGVREIDDNLVNENISWEKANKLNIGTDISLFNNKLQITADYYNDKYYDLLQTRGKSIELIGLNYPNENIGENRFKGFEFSITYQDNIADFNYFITANISRQKSEVLFMDEQYVQEEYQRRTGRPVGVWMGYVADGFFQSEEEIKNGALLAGYDIKPGDIKYKDLNNDGVIDQYDQTVIGNDKPLTYFGINLGFEYKGLEVSALVQGAYNRDIYLPDAGAAYVLPFMSKNQHYGQAYDIAMNRWTPETAETATFPRLSAGIGTGFGLNSYNTSPGQVYNSFWIRSGDYVRLKNVSIAYTLPSSFSNNYLGGLRIKVFVNGQNLLTKSAYNDLDPEVLNFSNYPNLRGFNTGFNIKF